MFAYSQLRMNLSFTPQQHLSETILHTSVISLQQKLKRQDSDKPYRITMLRTLC